MSDFIVKTAIKYENHIFPTRYDILAIIAIESSFNPMAKSKLKTDPAVGLMQVRPKVWNVNRVDLESSIDKQIEVGAEILQQYYDLTGDKVGAIMAYNVGITSYKSGKKNRHYLKKYQQEVRNLILTK